MPKINSKNNNPPKKPEISTGFLGGLNTFQDETVLKDSELTRAKNILLTVDGIEPRPGIAHYGSDNGDSRVFGGFGYYMANGTHEFLRMSGGKLYKKNGTSWTQIGSTTWNATARMNFLQARDLVFMWNGVDPLAYYNGTTITVYTALTTPAGLAVTTAGTAGTTAYSYRVSAFNATGETLACVAVNLATGNALLDATNYNKLDWTATAGAVGYNIWGRKSTGLGETYITTTYTNQYLDKGEFDPSTAILPPESNTTTGIICKKAIFAQSRIFAAGDPTYNSRLYYGGVGSNITNFSFSETGGGATDIFKNDGSEIRDILPFQGGVIVWKDNAIYKFYFNSSGQPTLEEITRSFGGIAWRGSKHVENDIIFPARKDGRLAFYSLGNQENYSAGILRTNELSIKVASELVNVSTADLENSCAFYFNNVYGCAITKTGGTYNNRIWCLDTRFGAWTYWEGLYPNFFMNYVDTDGTENLYYGSENTGYIEEMFQDDKNDNGSAISVEWATKSFNQKAFHKIKKYYNPVFQFKNIATSSVVSGEVILDGAISSADFSITTTTAGGMGFGAMLFGFPKFGESLGGTVSQAGVSSDTIVELSLVKKARSIKYVFRSNTVNADYKFLSVAHDFAVLDGKRLPSTVRYY